MHRILLTPHEIDIFFSLLFLLCSSGKVSSKQKKTFRCRIRGKRERHIPRPLDSALDVCYRAVSELTERKTASRKWMSGATREWRKTLSDEHYHLVCKAYYDQCAQAPGIGLNFCHPQSNVSLLNLLNSIENRIPKWYTHTHLHTYLSVCAQHRLNKPNRLYRSAIRSIRKTRNRRVEQKKRTKNNNNGKRQNTTKR